MAPSGMKFAWPTRRQALTALDQLVLELLDWLSACQNDLELDGETLKFLTTADYRILLHGHIVRGFAELR